jgi:hypothetical protein
MTPMLQLPEAAAGKRFELSFATTQTHATLNDTGGAFTKLAWNGTTTKQTVTVASRLWNRFHLSIESGYGGHKGDIEFEVDQGAARGGTTFLMSGSSDAGMLDTQINLHTVIESGRFLIRPHLRLKLPTGDQEQLLSNGGIDAGFGTSFETLFKGWNINTQISYIQPADLDFFDAGQTSLASKNYVYMGLGLGHQLWDENTRVAFALNWMSHPLQGTTDLSTLDQPLSTLAMQVGQNFSYGHASVDVSSGITASSPRISVGLNLKVWF